MRTISIEQIESDLAGFIQRLEAGECLVVVRGDRPVAEVKPLPSPLREPRPAGLYEGQFMVPDDFDEPLPEEIIRAFYGE